VIPTGISIHKNGASKGAAVSFLISTPQTGIDSIMVTYSMLGLPFAIIRPIVALITGIFGGALTNKTETPATFKSLTEDSEKSRSKNTKPLQKPIFRIFKYAFIDFMEDIAKWLVIGLLIAALIATLVPDDFFANYVHSDFIGMLLILVASIPLYVCATSSVPIAAVLIMKGISPGAALIFLMAGPATNAATISVIGNSMGRKTLIYYLSTLIAGSIVFGLIIDYLLPREWFTAPITIMAGGHAHELLPPWIQILSAVVFSMALLNIFISKLIKRISRTKKHQQKEGTLMNQKMIFVRGMNCNHCKNSVESSLKSIEGVTNIVADIDAETVVLDGENIDLEKVKNIVEGIGYKYDGEVV
jgi:uncharacterized membrane protein YraQ (UPF0718 family)/copper chaperone CopZ